MYHIKQYGFSLIPTPSSTEEQYLLLKRNIELTCKIAEQASEQLHVKDANLAYRLGPNLFLSISLVDGKATFGVFDMNKSVISDTVAMSLFQNFTTQSFAKFRVRCFQTLQTISLGNSYNLGKLNEAWTAYFESQLLQNKSQTITM